MNTFKQMLNEGKRDYEIYHKSYTSAVDEMLAFVKKNGYEIPEDEIYHGITTGPGRPSAGRTTRHSLKLTKNGKETRKSLHSQVYGMDGRKESYELNQYIS